MGALKPVWQWPALALASFALAFVLGRLGFPAALLLGPLVSGIAFALAGATIKVPSLGFVAAQAVVGCIIARGITGSIVSSVLDAWPVMLAVVCATVVASALAGLLLTRLGTLPGKTAAWGSAPGAASAMVAMSESFGADPRLVAFMQYLRVACVVLTASVVTRWSLGVEPGGAASAHAAGAPLDPIFGGSPLSLALTLAIAVVGALAARALRLPAAGFLGPLILGSALHATGLVDIALPPWLVGLAYAALGWSAGLRFTYEIVRYTFRALPQMLVSIGLLIGLCCLSAWALTVTIGTDPLTAFLATTPGGLDTVAIIALGTPTDLPFILALQTLRLFLVILTGPALARLISKFA